jgi:hypothetical protein
LGEQLLRHSYIYSNTLQAKMAHSTVKTLESLRTNKAFLSFYKDAKERAADFDIDGPCMPRQTRPPKKKLTKDLCITTTLAKISTELDIWRQFIYL